MATMVWGHAPICAALDPSRGRYDHTLWQTPDGLPQSAIRAIAQTDDGYLWLGTLGGLARFDGARFVTFGTENAGAFRSDRILSLFPASDGSLWIGTRLGGVVRLKDGQFTHYDVRDVRGGFVTRAVFGFTEDGPRNVWAGCEQGSILSLQGGLFAPFKFSPEKIQIHGPIRSLARGPDGEIWLGGIGFLYRLQNQKLVEYSVGSIVLALLMDRAGTLWIGTREGLRTLRDGAISAYQPKEGLSNDPVAALCQDRDGNMWLGTRHGLCRIRDDHVTVYTTNDGLPSNTVDAIFEDREGSLWVGTPNGLVRFKDTNVAVISTREGLPNERVSSVLQARNGDVWVGSDGGVTRISHGVFRTYSTSDGLPENTVWSLGESGDGSLWIGTERAGFSRLKDGRFVNYGEAQGVVPVVQARAIAEDHAGTVWLGTEAGLSRFEDGRWIRVDRDIREIRCITERKAGGLWIGTANGLVRFEDGQMRTYRRKDGLASDVILSLYEDVDGTLWVGTGSGGLSRFKQDRFVNYTMREGLPDNVVFAVLDDRRSNLWMSSPRGIFWTEKKQLDDLAAGRLASLSCDLYDTTDGLMSFGEGGYQPAGWRMTDGRLWFPTLGGLAVIDPSNLRRNQRPPPVVIEDVTINETKIDPRAFVRIPPGPGNIAFHYTGLSFLVPGKVRFMYRLEGYEGDWVEAGTRRAAYYTNMAPGRYTFRVKACNNDDVWNETGASFTFDLTPHFYQTRWFAVFCLAAAGFVGWSVYRFRVRRLTARQRALSKKIANAMVAERDANEKLRQNQERLLVAERMTSLGRVTAGLAHEMNTPLAAVRMSLLEIDTLATEYQNAIDDIEVTPADHKKIGHEIRAAVEIARAAAERAVGFVRGIKSQTSRLGPEEREPFNAVAVIEGALLLVNHAAWQKNCVVRFERSAGEVILTGVPEKFGQVVSNLVVNAIEASPAGGTICVILQAGPAEAQLTITDEGPGIAPEILPKVFDPMFTTKPYGPGMGLGLTIARDTVTAEFGGTIALDSQLGRGTTVTIRIPVVYT